MPRSRPMTTSAAQVEDRSPEVEEQPLEDREPSVDSRSWVPFAAWGTGAYLLVTGSLLAFSLMVTGGTFVYLIDDPAIHLSMARTLAETGTWGVVPGQFQSASSAPLWTLALSAVHLVSPVAAKVAPIIFNVGFSIAVIVLLARYQDVLRPRRDRPLDGIAVAFLCVSVLFLPGLTLLGMEHVAHLALVVAIVIAFGRAASRSSAWPGWTLIVLLAVAALVRFESSFVALGLAIATVVVPSALPVTRRVQRSVVIVAAAAVPTAAFALFNRAMGQGWLPNSVLAKAQVVSGSSDRSAMPSAILERLTTDPVVIGLVILAAGIAIVGWGRWASVRLAVAFLVATSLHMSFAGVGWFDRYQAYLVGFGVVVLLGTGTEIGVGDRLASRGRVSLRPALLVLALVLLCGTKIGLTRKVPVGVEDTYQQRYQAARFLERYYHGEPIATGELGYISLFHDGPLTDVLGLGDFDVLQMRRENHQEVPPAKWAQLAHDRGFRVVAVDPLTLFTDTPDEWILVGEWHLDRDPVTAFGETFQFWATTPEEVAPLQQHLRDFESEMPEGARLDLNDLASYRAEQMLAGG